jgi:G:T-mismatch repair DNA endonuclease (very short patch repair protein)
MRQPHALSTAGDWEAKFSKTIRRDAEATMKLETLGWLTINVWECEVSPERLDRLYQEIVAKGQAVEGAGFEPA